MYSKWQNLVGNIEGIVIVLFIILFIIASITIIAIRSIIYRNKYYLNRQGQIVNQYGKLIKSQHRASRSISNSK